MSTLGEYNRKRQFDKTDEPPGREPNNGGRRLRFVVQHHIARRDHYDFRLEWGGVLKSWAVPKGPSYDSRDKRLAVRVEDHPLEYRNFEGAIPKGQYGGGVVMIWDEGFWTPLVDAAEGLAQGLLKFTLEGQRLRGSWALVRMKQRPGEDDVNWLLIKEKDIYENSADIREFVTSSRSGRTMTEIEAGKTAEVSEKKMGPSAKRRQTPAAGREKAAGPARSVADVVITNPDKILYEESGITKGEVAAYYRKVAARMLLYLENRILSEVRCPGGIDSSCFYKRHPAGGENVVAAPVAGNDGETEEYFYIVDACGLLSEVQMNTLEFHTWGSRVESLEQPDMMVFDLDPDEGLDLAAVRQGVLDLRDLLDRLSLTSYLKTSGGKGYHIVIPFEPTAGWDAFHEFAHKTARAMEATWPDRYTSNVRKDSRSGRIFIDWIRNGRGATSVAPYSLRARDGAPVSMPIAWKELDTVAPNGVTMADAVKRLRRKDPWAGLFEHRQRLK